MKQRSFFILEYLKLFVEEVQISMRYPLFYLIYLSLIVLNNLLNDEWMYRSVIFMILLKMSIHDIKTFEIYESDQALLLLSVYQPMPISGFPILILSFLYWMCKKEKLGCADLKLMSIGTFMVEEDWMLSVLIASILAIIYALIFDKRDQDQIAFGPFIAISLLLFLK